MSSTTTSTTKTTSTTSNTPVLVTSFPVVPLTETFTATKDDCSGIYLSYVGMIDLKTSCLPSGFKPNPSSFFSPGIACPSGYYTACHDTTGVRSITTVTCCPYRDDITLSCVDPLTRSEIWSTLFCTWNAPQDTSTTVSMTLSSNGVTSTIVSTMMSPQGLNAYGIRMVYESTDLSTTPASVTDTSTSTSSTGTPSTTAPSGGSSSGLSAGASAGIGVGVAVVAIAALLGLFLWWRRRRAVPASVVGGPMELAGQDKPSPMPSTAPGLYGYYGDNAYKPPGIQPDLPRAELPDMGPAAELPADGHHR